MSSCREGRIGTLGHNPAPGQGQPEEPALIGRHLHARPSATGSAPRRTSIFHSLEVHAGSVAAGPVKAGDKTHCDRVGADSEDDRNSNWSRLWQRATLACCPAWLSWPPAGGSDRRPSPAADHPVPPPSGIRSSHSDLRHSPPRLSLCGGPIPDWRWALAKRNAEIQPPTLPPAARAPRAATRPGDEFAAFQSITPSVRASTLPS